MERPASGKGVDPLRGMGTRSVGPGVDLPHGTEIQGVGTGVDLPHGTETQGAGMGVDLPRGTEIQGAGTGAAPLRGKEKRAADSAEPLRLGKGRLTFVLGAVLLPDKVRQVLEGNRGRYTGRPFRSWRRVGIGHGFVGIELACHAHVLRATLVLQSFHVYDVLSHDERHPFLRACDACPLLVAILAHALGRGRVRDLARAQVRRVARIVGNPCLQGPRLWGGSGLPQLEPTGSRSQRRSGSDNLQELP